MMLNVYSVFDKVAGEAVSSLALLTAPSDELIIRTLKTAKLGDIVEENLADFDLYQIGVFDSQKPGIVGLENAKFIAHLEAIK